MTFHDISIPLSPSTAVWPGDTPVTMQRLATLEQGDTVNLGTLTASLHAGTHADAPFHFDAGGSTIDCICVEAYVGASLVLDVSGRHPITIADLSGAPLDGCPRLLLRTGSWADHTVFPDAVPTIAADVPAFLASKGVFLLGLDVPSVDAIDSKDLPNHHALARHGIHILESLDLSDIEPGVYQLSALPLRVTGADAAPVRAVLWR